MLAQSSDEIPGWFGGLSPDELWTLAGTLRREAARRQLPIRDAVVCLNESVRRFRGYGWTIHEVATELGVEDSAVVDEIVRMRTNEGWSNRRIASELEGRSYKWVERRRRHLFGDSPPVLAA